MFQTTNQVQIIAPYLPTETSTLAAGSPSYLHQGTESSPVKPRPPFKFPFTKWRKPGPEMAGQSRKECKIWGVPNMGVPQVTMGWKILKWSIWSNFAANTCAMPATLLGWLSGTSFLLTLTVLCGLPLCYDDMTWCPSHRFVRDVIDDPLQGFGYNTIAAFNTCLHKPYRKPTKTLGKILNLTLKKPCKNYIIVKYLVGVADVLQVILDDVWYPHQKCDGSWAWKHHRPPAREVSNYKHYRTECFFCSKPSLIIGG